MDRISWRCSRALVTGILNGWLAWLTARRDRRRTLDDAIIDLQSSARTFVNTVDVFRQVAGDQRLALYQALLSAQLDRVIRATEIIGQVTQDKHLSELADAYAEAVMSYYLDSEETITRVTKARKDFTSYSRDRRRKPR
jgi:hypothetical protein